jgi:hypothetical protein
MQSPSLTNASQTHTRFKYGKNDMLGTDIGSEALASIHQCTQLDATKLEPVILANNGNNISLSIW